jgi:hypothetical protein
MTIEFLKSDCKPPPKPLFFYSLSILPYFNSCKLLAISQNSLSGNFVTLAYLISSGRPADLFAGRGPCLSSSPSTRRTWSPHAPAPHLFPLHKIPTEAAQANPSPSSSPPAAAIRYVSPLPPRFLMFCKLPNVTATTSPSPRFRGHQHTYLRTPSCSARPHLRPPWRNRIKTDCSDWRSLFFLPGYRRNRAAPALLRPLWARPRPLGELSVLFPFSNVEFSLSFCSPFWPDVFRHGFFAGALAGARAGSATPLR